MGREESTCRVRAEDGIGSEQVMAAVDDSEGQRRLVIADVSEEGSWLSMPTDAAVTVPDLR